MTMRSDQKALLFLGAVGVLGAGVRVVRTAAGQGTRAAQPALDHQMHVADSAAQAQRKSQGKTKTKSGRGRKQRDSSAASSSAGGGRMKPTPLPPGGLLDRREGDDFRQKIEPVTPDLGGFAFKLKIISMQLCPDRKAER